VFSSPSRQVLSSPVSDACRPVRSKRLSPPMAGIVASTLRRKAFHRGGRGSDQAKFVTMASSAAAQSSETVGHGAALPGSGVGTGPMTAGHAASYSPSVGGSRSPSRSSSFAFRSTELDDQQQRPGTGTSLHQHGHTGTQVSTTMCVRR